MPKMLSKKNRRNSFVVKKQLEGRDLIIMDDAGHYSKMSGAEALLLGFDLLNQQRKYEPALSVADQLLEVFPKVIDIWLLKLRALIRLERLKDAEEVCDYLLKVAPSNVGVLVSSAEFRLILNDADAAKKSLLKAQALDTKNLAVNNALVALYSQIGERGFARKICRANYKYAKRNVEIKLVDLIQTIIGVGEYEGIDNEMRAILREQMDLVDNDLIKSRIAFALAKDAGKAKELKVEISYLHRANQYLRKHLESSGTVWDLQRVYQLSALNKETFSGPGSHRWEKFNSGREERPIFVMGMPRSGTTLLEQMLGSHSQVAQTGESKAFSLALREVLRESSDLEARYPEMVLNIDNVKFSDLAQRYIDYQRMYSGKEVFVDKHLASYKFAGLQALLFPKAKFIHISRHPLDIILSCYRSSIPGVPATCSLQDMAYEYLEMKKLVNHWKSVYPEQVVHIRYSDLVSSPEDTMRDLTSFLKLPWEKGVLEFNKRKNTVRTISLHQVRKGIYTNAIDKWVPYKELLTPAINILQEKGVLDSSCNEVFASGV